jgi:nucleotide-binding universal stress UspA family protein
MMKKIIAVLNDFQKADDLLQKAVTLTKEHNAILEILYVHEEPLFDIPDYFRLDNSIKENIIDKEKITQEIKNRVKKLGLEKDCAVLAFVDDTVDRVLTQTDDDTDTLIITPYHEKITQKLVKKSHLPVIVVKNSINEYKRIVLPVDLSDSSRNCIDLANKIFPHAQKRLLHDYRYVLDTAIMDVDYLGMPTTDPIMNTQINQELKQAQLESFEVLKKETGLEGDFIEETLSIEEDLAQYINISHFDLTVLCSHKKHFLLSNSLSFSLLETLENDILIF